MVAGAAHSSLALSHAAFGPPASLYLHIPFCMAKCSYCDFASYPLPAEWYAPYVEALQREVGTVGAGWGRPQLDTLYVGGGTPTVLPTALLAGLLAAVGRAFDLAPTAEVTLEANPGTVTLDALEALCRAGANRLSLGVQSFQAHHLRLLGRIHTAAQAAAAVALARQAGFANVNLDLIYALPGETLAEWQADLGAALALGPEHLSLYALTLEVGTPLQARVACGEVPTPDSELAAAMYELAERTLAERGWEHYEISNWGRTPGLRARHNLTYWHNLPYAGCGAAAHSWLRGERRANVRAPREYIERLAQWQDPVAEAEAISAELERSETMILGLRLVEGVSRAAYRDRFGADPADLYPEAVAESVSLGLLEVTATHMRLTARGRLLGNQVFYRFLP